MKKQVKIIEDIGKGINLTELKEKENKNNEPIDGKENRTIDGDKEMGRQ